MHRRTILQGAGLVAVSALAPASVRAPTAPLGPTDTAQAHGFPAAAANYTAAGPGSVRAVSFVVVHVAQQSFTRTLGIFRDPAKQVSAHYVVRSGDGYVAQCVAERDIAWHAGNWDYNTRSIGIEHEGWVDAPEYFTPAMYAGSARLTAGICDRHRVPKDRDHVVGHHQVPGSDHTDPGIHWDWDHYLHLVNKF
ncbi:N-acetylmuramoyl-L-alanine amidase [uncultured Streptomyces sp.]|uniref:N-acetylmuramoyl-L-alanine amidase n=1 Tax=uncultured Streptomyces sp. TaxID=174707 RepID=UPI002603F516|nr:N-acetylmuramoyl-L-alanine amidase [uncultured Streptomyces sp.]